MKLFLIAIFSFSSLILAQSNSRQVVPIPIFYDGGYVAEVNTIFANSMKPVSIDIKESLPLFEKFLEKSLFQQVNAYVNMQRAKFIKLNKLRNAGLSLVYDESTTSFQLKVKLIEKYPQPISLRGSSEIKWKDQAVAPNDFTAFLNFRNTQKFNKTNTDENLNTQFDGAINTYGAVLEGRFRYDGNQDRKWIREDVTLIKDDEKNSVRYSLGDLQYTTVGFQSFRGLGGVSVSKNFSLRPYDIITPVNAKEFILKKRSRVKIFVNNQLVEILNLPSGRFNLRDFPINNGINEVYLEIRQDGGEVERLYFDYTLQEELLKEGLHNFSYSVGTPYTDLNGQRKYDQNDEELTTSLFHRYGINKNFTAGVYAEFDKFQSLAGPEFVYASPIGSVKITGGLSDTNSLEQGHSYSINYDLYDYEGPDDSERRFQFSYQYKSETFAQLDNIASLNTISDIFTVGYRQQVSDFFSYNIGMDYSIATVGENSYGTSLAIFRNWNRYLSSSINFQRRQATSGIWESSVLAFLNINFSDGKHYSNIIHNSTSEQYKANLRGNYTHNGASIYTDYGVEKSKDYERADARAEYRHRRFDFTVNSSGEKNETTTGASEDYETTVGISGAIVFAGGKFAISRPIENSFAILDSDESLENQRVTFNTSGAQASARIDGFGPAVIGNLVPYQYSRSHAQLVDFDGMTTLKKEYFPLFAKYKSGHYFQLSAKSNIILVGQLVNARGVPLKHKIGELVFENGEKSVFFTNTRGEFFIEGANIGKNDIKLRDYAHRPIRVQVKQGQKGIVEVGRIYVKK